MRSSMVLGGAAAGCTQFPTPPPPSSPPLTPLPISFATPCIDLTFPLPPSLHFLYAPLVLSHTLVSRFHYLPHLRVHSTPYAGLCGGDGVLVPLTFATPFIFGGPAHHPSLPSWHQSACARSFVHDALHLVGGGSGGTVPSVPVRGRLVSPRTLGPLQGYVLLADVVASLGGPSPRAIVQVRVLSLSLTWTAHVALACSYTCCC
jgi:hypothetical protein